MEISFWFGKGDIPNEKNRLPPLEVHFGVGGCGRTVSAGGAGKNKMLGGPLNKKIRLLPLEVHFRVGGCGRTDSAGGAGQE